MSARRPPVVLLPGAFGQELVYWNVWQYFLERDGYHVYPASFPRFTFSDHRVSARFLAEKIDEVLAVEDTGKVALVAHSFGGLIARYYLKYLDGAKNVTHLSCLGTPHQGTWTAATAPILTATRQSVPGSPFLAELNDRNVGHGGVPILNIWSKWDGIIVPAANAVLDEPGVVNRQLPYAGHWGLLVSRRAYVWIKEALENQARLAETTPR
ncbi:MAG: alpha/beta fold hydrolase [Candidatus Thermoplasmatota archaeon]